MQSANSCIYVDLVMSMNVEEPDRSVV